MRMGWFILAGVLVGGFLTFAAFALGGAGHGSIWPLIVYDGVGATIGGEKLKAWAWWGPVLYGAYGAVVAWMAARPKAAVWAGVGLLAFHYINVAAAVMVWRSQLPYDHFEKAIRYQAPWFGFSAAVFVGLHVGLAWWMWESRRRALEVGR